MDATPKIETFEHDISEEIKRKEANITTIAATGGELTNTAPEEKKSATFLIAGIGILILLIGLGYGYYVFQKDAYIPPTQVVEQPTTTTFRGAFPGLEDAIGRFVIQTEKKEPGYVITISDYSPVLAYIIRNEALFGENIAESFGMKILKPNPGDMFVFSDFTKSNQNMRVGALGSTTVVYGFVGTNILLISPTAEGLLVLRSGILK
jgi:hypothetical protein